MAQAETRRLAAMMFTDMVGFSRQMGTNEAHSLCVLDVHNQLIHQAVVAHHGHVIKVMGDAFLVDFPPVVHAVPCAQHLQGQFKAHNAEKEPAEQIRCPKTVATCQELLKVEPALWTLVRVPGVDLTKNAAERGLRHAVQWRKTSYGTDSVAGSHFVENVLTGVASCRQQERNVLEYLTHCCQAWYAGTPPPSLLPQPAS